MVTSRDWQSLERKLQRGVPLGVAAEQAGIPVEEAEVWARTQLKNADASDVTLLKTADSALEHAFGVLQRIALGGQRTVSEEEVTGMGEDMVRTITRKNSDDLEAAKALLSASLAVRKMLGGAPRAKEAGKVASVQLDIFDNRGNWELEEVK